MSEREGFDGDAREDVAGWMALDQPDADVIVTSRIRLARNVRGFPFRACLGEDEGRRLESTLRDQLRGLSLAADQDYISLEQASALDRELLLENHFISVEMARGKGPRGVALSRSRHLSVMVNEEDHLRVQMLAPGAQLPGLMEEIKQIDRALGEVVDYATHERFGFLTSCPTNVGTGLRLSVMMHLPALVFSKEIEKEFNAAAKMKLAVRGFYGEGTQFLADFFQVSNQVTLGKTREQLLGDLLKVVPTVLEHERDVRRKIQRDHRVELEDRVYRASGILRNARRISSQEALEQLSQLRLGVCLGMVGDVGLGTINELLVITQPAHVQSRAGRDLTEEERDEVRANDIRERLTKREGGGS